MIIDNLSNANTYFSLHPLFKKAFEYLNTLDLKQLEAGSTQLQDDALKVSVIKTKMKTKLEAKLETHQKYIDIQIPIEQKETFGWRSLSNLKDSEKEYDPVNDIEFFNDEPSTYFTLLPGEFAIFFPEDGHAPLIGKGDTKKIIVKIAVNPSI